MIMGAEEKLYSLEYELFCEVRDTLAGEMEPGRIFEISMQIKTAE